MDKDDLVRQLRNSADELERTSKSFDMLLASMRTVNATEVLMTSFVDAGVEFYASSKEQHTPTGMAFRRALEELHRTNLRTNRSNQIGHTVGEPWTMPPVRGAS